MKTLKVYFCESFDRYQNYPIDYTLEIDTDGILTISKVSRDEQYETNEIAVYRNWDYYKIEEETEISE